MPIITILLIVALVSGGLGLVVDGLLWALIVGAALVVVSLLADVASSRHA
jgi:hypothetical protein